MSHSRFKYIAPAFVLMAVLGHPAPAHAGFFDKLKEALSSDSGETSTTAQALSNADISAGLREALRVSTQRVVSQVGVEDGFNADPKIHIPLPKTLQNVQSMLGKVGMSALGDELELKMNRAAEAAAPEAKELFIQAISEMTLDDVKAIYNGPDDAATKYFRDKMTPQLTEKMTPVVNTTLSDVGAVKAYDAMMDQYKDIPFMPDVKSNLTDYAVKKTINGIFFYLGKEEAAIRQDPAKRTTELLQKVFGGK